MAQLIVIDQVLITEGDPKHPLPDQRPDLMLDQLRCPAIRETLSKPLDHPDRPIRRSEQQRTRIRGDLATIKPRHYCAAIDGCVMRALRRSGSLAPS